MSKMMSLDLPDEFTRPNYAESTIANIPAAVAAMLGAEFHGLRPLPTSHFQPISTNLKRVVLLIIDGWGQNLLQQEQPHLTSLLNQAQIQESITSIFPSTTVAALSSLWTGVPAAQHGLVGLKLFFPEQASLGNMIHFSPAFGRYPDALVEAGVDPKTFLAVPGVAEQLAAGGVATHIFKSADLVNTALSQMHGRGAAADHGIKTFADMMVSMRHLLESKPTERMFISGYWSMVDSLSHEYGWNHPAVAAELRALMWQFEAELLGSLSAAARRDTAVFIVADHGQIVTPRSKHIDINDHPDLRQMLFMRPAGEPRVPYFYAKHGQQQAILDYLHHHLSGKMVAYPATDVLRDGLLGDAPFATGVTDRVGDVIGIMRDGYAFLSPRERGKGFHMQGRHAGLTAAEMQVPWLGFRLDA